MIEDKKYQEQYIKGFNDGYLVSKFEPQLYNQVKAGNAEEPYTKGFEKGYRQCQREAFVANLQNSRKLNQQLKPRM